MKKVVNCNCFLGSENPTSKEIYVKMSQLIEKCSKIGFFVMGKLTPVCWIIPKAVICYFDYFTTDLGSEVWELPVFFW